MLNNVFGLKQSANLAKTIIIHPFGSSDIFDGHLHFHVTVIPVVIENNKPIGVDIDWIDNEKLRKKWKKLVIRHFKLPEDTEVTYPQISFIPTTQTKKLLHALKYDMRGFGDDLINAVVGQKDDVYYIKRAKYVKQEVFYDTDDKKIGDNLDVCDAVNEIATKYQRYISWHAVTVEDLAKLWLWIKKANLIQNYGWLKQINKYKDLLFVEEEENEAPEVIEVYNTEIRQIHERKFCRKTRKVKLIKKWEYKNKSGEWLKVENWWCYVLPDNNIVVI